MQKMKDRPVPPPLTGASQLRATVPCHAGPVLYCDHAGPIWYVQCMYVVQLVTA